MPEWISKLDRSNGIYVPTKQIGKDMIDLLVFNGCHINPTYDMESFMDFDWDTGRTLWVHDGGQIDHGPGKYEKCHDYTEVLEMATPIKHVCNANVVDIF